MRFLSFALGLTLVVAPVSWAFDKPAPKEKPPVSNAAPAQDDDEKSVTDQIEAVQKEFLRKRRDLLERYRAVDEDADEQKIVEEFNELRTELASKCMAIVEKHPDDEAVIPALVLLISSPDHAAEATRVFLKHHVDYRQIGTLCLELGIKGRRDAEPLMRGVAEKSKRGEARGLALLGLGQMLLASSNEDGLKGAERDMLRSQATEALKKVVKSYPDVEASDRKAGEWAEGLLYEAEHLSPGMTVPDLAGEDLEGEEFKLSDYRGKVVLLEFWAHW